MIPDFPSNDVDRTKPVAESIEDVPVYRREWFASILVVVGFFCCAPLLWWVCILCLTGDIYRNKVLANGRLARWSRANKVAAVFILVFQAGVYIWRFEHYRQELARRRAEKPSIIILERREEAP
jgi:hypothetical protein